MDHSLYLVNSILYVPTPLIIQISAEINTEIFILNANFSGSQRLFCVLYSRIKLVADTLKLEENLHGYLLSRCMQEKDFD